LLQGLAPKGGGSGARAQLWAGLPPAVPLWSLALSLAYYDSGLGLAAAAAHGAAVGQGAGTAQLPPFTAARLLPTDCALRSLLAVPTLLVIPSFFYPAACSAGGEAAAEQWEPIISPLLLQACWQQLEAAWGESGAVSGEALRRYASCGAVAGEGAEAGEAAGMLGAYLQLHGVPSAAMLQQTAGQVQEMLRGAQLQDATAATAAAAAMLAATHRHLGLPAAQAIAAALLH
jgi:hypothetical protein